MLYPSELRAHSRHYRRFFEQSAGGVQRVNVVVRSLDHCYSSSFLSRLIFWRAFLMFLSLVDLFPQATQQGDGWTLVKTIAKTRKLYRITP